MKPIFLIPAALLITVAACKQPANTDTKSTQGNTAASTADSGVYFANLKNGDTVKSPVIIQMGVKGKTVAPAGTMDMKTGHYHIIIDGNYTEKGQMVMKDSTHLHFGKGQTVDTLPLRPGTHTLTLQFADGAHMSYGKDWSNTITVIVK